MTTLQTEFEFTLPRGYVDKDGNLCPTDGSMIGFTVGGAGKFRAGANGDPTCIDLFHMPGHTVSQTAVYIPDEKVLFSGDNVVYKVKAWLHDAVPERWLESLNELCVYMYQTLNISRPELYSFH